MLSYILIINFSAIFVVFNYLSSFLIWKSLRVVEEVELKLRARKYSLIKHKSI